MEKIKTSIRNYANEQTTHISKLKGRLILMAGNADIDLRDIVDWVKENEPMLLE